MSLSSLGSHQLLVLWVELSSLLVAARLLGALARRIGQPAVVGELVAGLLLGPSVFGHLWAGGFRWFIGGTSGSQPLAAVVQVSLLILLVVIGAETDLRLIRRLGRAATSVSAASLVVPMAAGAGLALFLPAVLVGPKSGRAVFALLVAAAVGVSSLPVIAKIVTDLGLVRRNVGQLAIAVGTANDATGFLVLAVASGLVGAAGASSVHLGVALAGVVGITIFLLTAGQRVFDALLRRVRRKGPNVVGSLGVCVIGSLAAAAAMQAVGVEGALGAFVAGVALGRSRFQQGRSLEVLETMTTTVFSPLYFATAGLRVDLGVLGRSSVLFSLVAIVVVACVFKFAGVMLGARASSMHWREGTALGVALNGRGALQVIIGTAGLSLGILDSASYTLVILMSLVTSIATAPLLRVALRGWAGTPEEQQRLEREEELDRNVIVRGQRLLLPSRGRPNSLAAAEVLAATWPEESEVTILSIGERDGRGIDVDTAAQVFGPRSVERRHVSSDRLLEEIIAEAQLGYGVVGMGVADEPNPEHLLSPVLDELLIRSPIPLVLVRRGRGVPSGGRPAFSRVIVPVTGTAPARAGQEVAFNLARSRGTEVALVHVVTRSDAAADVEERALVAAARPSGSTETPSRRLLPGGQGAADVVVRGAMTMAAEMGVEPQVLTRRGGSPGDELVRAVRETGADTVAFGTAVRQVDGKPFLGHTVEQVLSQSEATVIVVVLPESSSRLGAMVAEMSGQA